jgi:hypothetical protein
MPPKRLRTDPEPGTEPAEAAIVAEKEKETIVPDKIVEISGEELMERLLRCQPNVYMMLQFENSHHFRNMIKTVQSICGNDLLFRINHTVMECEEDSSVEPKPFFHLEMDSRNVEKTAFVHFEYPIQCINVNVQLLTKHISVEKDLVQLPDFSIPLDRLLVALNGVASETKNVVFSFGHFPGADGKTLSAVEQVCVRSFMSPTNKATTCDSWKIPLNDLSLKKNEIRRKINIKYGRDDVDEKELMSYLIESYPIENLKFIYQVQRLDNMEMVNMIREDISKECRFGFKVFTAKDLENTFVLERKVENQLGHERINRVVTKLAPVETLSSSSSSSSMSSSDLFADTRVSVENKTIFFNSDQVDHLELEAFVPDPDRVIFDYKFSSVTLETIFKHISKTDDFTMSFAKSGHLMIDINKTKVSGRQSGLSIILQPVVCD